MVLKYEDGSLPATAWNVSTLGVVASWYARNVDREQAKFRYERHFHRNRQRLTHRLGETLVPADTMSQVDAQWESILAKALEVAGPQS